MCGGTSQNRIAVASAMPIHSQPPRMPVVRIAASGKRESQPKLGSSRLPAERFATISMR